MQIIGYAVVGDDDCIADAEGNMPDVLKNDVEWDFFQAGLDAADVIVLGRLSHEVTPNPAGRRRLVMTRSVEKLYRQGDTVMWNPEGASLGAALAEFDCHVECVAITGGRDVFDYFLTGENRFSIFHLSRICGATVPDGTGVFGAVEAHGLAATAILSAAGYCQQPVKMLDPGVELLSWTPAMS